MRLYRLLSFVWNHPLNANGKWAAIGRVARWQLASRLMEGPVAFPYVEGTRLFASRGMTGATGNWYCGLHELNDMAFVLHLLREDDLFVDVGANIGSYTIMALSGEGVRVTSIEPIPETFAHLERNLALNGFGKRVNACCLGLSDHVSSLRFTVGLGCVNHVVTKGEDVASVEVTVTTLDSLVGSDVPTLIKIDVEGHERAVLRGATRTLADRRLLAVIMEINGSGARYGVDDNELVDVMRDNKFSPYGYDPFARALIKADRSGGNMIFVRDVEAVSRRVSTARRFRLVNGEI